MKQTEKIVEEILAEVCRSEANKILSLSDTKEVQDFVKYYKENKKNICCLHLDYLKGNLVKKGKMKQEENDHFNGDIFN